MGLLIWVPCVNGDYHNQGTLNVEMSTLGSIVYEDGKLGKAVKIGTGTQVTNGIRFNSNLVEELGTEYSCSVWIKPMGNHVHYEGAIISSGDWNKSRWAFGVNQNNTKVDAFGRNYNCHVTCTIPVGEWTHLVSTMKNNIAKVYKNGTYVGSYTFSDGALSSDSTYTCIGRETYASGYFGFNGYIQDVRIYDYCLSEQEIKKLSQGLILHLPLSRKGFGQDNLVNNTTIPLIATSQDSYTSRNLGQSKLPSLTAKELLLQACDNGLTLSYDVHCPGIYQNPNLSLNRIGCYESFTIKDNTTGTSKSFYGHHSMNGIATNKHTLNKNNSLNSVSTSATADNPDTSFNGHYSRTIWPKENATVLAFYNNPDNYTITSGNTNTEIRGFIKEESWVKNVHLEFGDKETSWTPHPNDTIYSRMGLDDNIEKDISGYQNNAEKNGSITITNDSPYLGVSYNFGTTGRIGPINISSSSLSGNWTISWWSKVDSASNIMPWAFNGGNKLNFYWSGTGLYWNTGDSTQNPFRNDSGTTIKFTTYLGNWHHFVVVSNGETNILYIDGEYMGKSKTYKDPTSNVLYISGYGYSLSTTYSWRGDISDFRMYATALSADDVKDLYEKR